MNRYYISDLHLGHQKLADMRGFDSVQDHDDFILSELAKLKANDTLWLLGDLAMGNPDRALAQLSKLPVRKHLIVGNHEQCWPKYERNHRYFKKYYTVFESVQLWDEHRIGSERVLVSHLPYAGDHRPVDRYAELRLRDLGHWLLHGHTHSDRVIRERQINVCWEAWQRPVSVGEIEEIISQEHKHT